MKTIDNQSFCQRVVEAASIRLDKVAMRLIEPLGGETITFGSMLSQIRSIAYRLQQEQIAFGDRVAIIGENHPHWAIAYLGILYRGAVVTPLDPAAETGALAIFLKDSEAKLVFVSPASVEKFRAACKQLGHQIPAVLLRPSTEAIGLGRFSDWASTPTPAEFDTSLPLAGPDDLALLMYTSGTTGRPKAVPLTHGNIYAESDKIEEVMKITDQEVILSLLPLFHAYSQVVNLWLATIVGAQVVYLSELSSAGIEQGLREGGATALTGVPRLWYLFHKKIFDALSAKPAPVRWLFTALLRLNGLLRDWLHFNAGRVFFRTVHRSFGGKLRLAVSAGASFDKGVAKNFHRLGFTILQGYGLTETAGAATITRFEDNTIGSVGTPLNGVEVRISEPNEGGVGEVVIRGPIVTSGYYHDPQANQEAFTPDGWFRSGDLGRFDDGGHLFIVGRKKDVIKLPSGKNVFPEDVEAHYEHSPFVSEVCVLGIADPASQFTGAEKLCAVVVPNFDYLKTRQIANSQDWVRWELENLGRELPEYQRVHDFIFRSEALPRTSTRKVRRFEVLEEIQGAGGNGQHPAKFKEPDFTAADRELMDSPAGAALTSAIKQHLPDVRPIHPHMNLEIDLGLDSLARTECMANVEHNLGITLEPGEVAAALTVAEVITLATAKLGHADGLSGARKSTSVETGSEGTNKPAAEEGQWHDALDSATSETPAFQSLNQRRPLTTLFAYLVLRVVYFGARLLFRMEVTGSDALLRLKPPYLICPNHQSYLDPLLLCSTLPLSVLKNVVHVGASMYFTNFAMAKLARLINIVPIDPDTHLLGALRAGAAALRAGKILNIYPEGQRSFDGQLEEFKKGAAILATELCVPIVPVAIDGTYLIWPRKSRRIRLAKVMIRFGQPIDGQSVAVGELDQDAIYEKVTATAKERIQGMLDIARATLK